MSNASNQVSNNPTASYSGQCHCSKSTKLLIGAAVLAIAGVGIFFGVFRGHQIVSSIPEAGKTVQIIGITSIAVVGVGSLGALGLALKERKKQRDAQAKLPNISNSDPVPHQQQEPQEQHKVAADSDSFDKQPPAVEQQQRPQGQSATLSAKQKRDQQEKAKTLEEADGFFEEFLSGRRKVNQQEGPKILPKSIEDFQEEVLSLEEFFQNYKVDSLLDLLCNTQCALATMRRLFLFRQESVWNSSVVESLLEDFISKEIDKTGLDQGNINKLAKKIADAFATQIAKTFFYGESMYVKKILDLDKIEMVIAEKLQEKRAAAAEEEEVQQVMSGMLEEIERDTSREVQATPTFESMKEEFTEAFAQELYKLDQGKRSLIFFPDTTKDKDQIQLLITRTKLFVENKMPNPKEWEAVCAAIPPQGDKAEQAASAAKVSLERWKELYSESNLQLFIEHEIVRPFVASKTEKFIMDRIEENAEIFSQLGNDGVLIEEGQKMREAIVTAVIEHSGLDTSDQELRSRVVTTFNLLHSNWWVARNDTFDPVQ